MLKLCIRLRVCGNQFIPLDLLDATDSDWGVEELAKKQWEPSQMNYVPSTSLQNSRFSLIPKNVATDLHLAKLRCEVWVASAGTQRLKPGKSHGEDGSGQAADLKGSEQIGGFSQLLGPVVIVVEEKKSQRSFPSIWGLPVR